MATDPLALATMVAYCGWDPTLVVANEPITLDGNGLRMLTLPSLYVTGVSSVVVTDQSGGTHTYLSTDTPATIGPGNTLIGWSENGTLINGDPALAGAWPLDTRNVVVTYSGGYSAIPAELQAVLDSLTARMPTAKAGLTAKRMGLSSFNYAASIAAGGLLTVEQMVLDRFRIVKAA